MKYMLLAYTGLDAWDETDVESEEFRRMCKFYEDLHAELEASGEFVSTAGLTHPALAQTVRPKDGAIVATDGPYTESKEVLASFTMIDCAGIDRAREIAVRIATAIGDTIEIRPLSDEPDGLDAGPPQR